MRLLHSETEWILPWQNLSWNTYRGPFALCDLLDSEKNFSKSAENTFKCAKLKTASEAATFFSDKSIGISPIYKISSKPFRNFK